MVRSFVRIAAACVLLATGAAAWAETPEEAFERGNAAYQDGRYGEAVAAYRGLLQFRIRDPRVEFNLANAEFKLGRLGAAILHYERARRLEPTDEDIHANLGYARSFAIDQVNEPEPAAVVRSIHGAQNRLGPDLQAWIALGLVWLTALLIAWGLASPGRWNTACGWSLAALLLAVTLSVSSWYVTHERLEGRELAVILVPAVEVLAGPGDNNATLFTVHEGLTVEIRTDGGEWMQVSLPNGLNGWLRADTVGIV